MKKVMALAMSLLLCLSLTACGSSAIIGVLQYTEHPALDKAYEGFVAALEEEGYSEDDIDFQNAQSDQGNCKTIASKFVADGKELIYAIATPAAQNAKTETEENPIPIVLSAVTDPASSGLVKSNEKPGGNVTGTSDLTPIKDQIELLTQLMPEAKTVAVMYCNAEDNSIFQATIAKQEIEAKGLTYVETTVTEQNQIQQVIESLIGKVDAIYIPTDNLLAEGMSTVAMVANENNLPCIVGEKGMAENGGLATYSIDYYQLGYMAGKQAVKILKDGKNPKDMPIEYLKIEDCEFVINETVAKKLNITIPAELKEKATFIK